MRCYISHDVLTQNKTAMIESSLVNYAQITLLKFLLTGPQNTLSVFMRDEKRHDFFATWQDGGLSAPWMSVEG